MNNRKLHPRALLALVGVFFLSGCASIISKSVYPVSISSNPSGAQVTVTNKDGVTVHSGNTPTQVSLSAGAGFFRGEEYVVKVSKNGDSARTTVVAGIDGWYFANIIFGGIIGMLIVDPATGAMWRLDENKHVDLNASGNGSALRIMNIEDIPEEARTALVPVR